MSNKEHKRTKSNYNKENKIKTKITIITTRRKLMKTKRTITEMQTLLHQRFPKLNRE